MSFYVSGAKFRWELTGNSGGGGDGGGGGGE